MGCQRQLWTVSVSKQSGENTTDNFRQLDQKLDQQKTAGKPCRFGSSFTFSNSSLSRKDPKQVKKREKIGGERSQICKRIAASCHFQLRLEGGHWMANGQLMEDAPVGASHEILENPGQKSSWSSYTTTSLSLSHSASLFSFFLSFLRLFCRVLARA